MLKSFIIPVLVFSSMALHARDRGGERPLTFGEHHGYLFDVTGERNKRDIEMVMLEKPKDLGPPLTEVIFNEKLSKEFQAQYQYRFGQTTTEQAINNPTRSEGYTYYTGENLTIQRYQEEQQNFAEYMSRRLIEFHVDNWAKNDPDFRPVYEVKDRISNVNVDVAKYKFKWKYNFAGPHMDLMVENPYDVEVKVRAEMSGVISSPTETIYSLGYQVTQRVRLQALHKQQDGLYQLIASRRMSKRISCSLTGSTDKRREGPTVQQDLILVGLSWSE